jgi:hypothetical protein
MITPSLKHARRSPSSQASRNSNICTRTASRNYRARAPLAFKAACVIAPLAAALGPGGRLRSSRRCGPATIRSFTTAIKILKAVKHELGPAARDLNSNAYADNRSLFRHEMHTLPSEIADAIGTSTLFAAWNAAIYVAQVEDDRLPTTRRMWPPPRRGPRSAAPIVVRCPSICRALR